MHFFQTHLCITRWKAVGRPSGWQCSWTAVISVSCQQDCRMEALWSFNQSSSLEVGADKRNKINDYFHSKCVSVVTYSSKTLWAAYKCCILRHYRLFKKVAFLIMLPLKMPGMLLLRKHLSQNATVMRINQGKRSVHYCFYFFLIYFSVFYFY